MEEEMITHCNIMSVDLAIKRELEYRKKMELLNTHHQSDFKPLIFAQGPQTPTRAGREDTELAPSGSQKSPIQMFSSSSLTFKERVAFSCKSCQMTFATVFHLSSHVGSQQHKENISERKKRKEAISNPIWCEICRSSSSSLGEMERHLNGSRHISKISDLTRNCKRKTR